MLWDDETIRKVKDAYASGITLKQIGLDIGCSRNAIQGKVCRLGLEKRPSLKQTISPEKREIIIMLIADGRSPTYIEKAAHTSRKTVWRIREQLMLELPPPVHKPLPVCLVPVPYVPILPARTCQWVEGPRYKQTHCGERSVSGTSWCGEHCKTVFLPRRVRVPA